MSAFMIRKGEILTVGGEIDELVKHARLPNKVTEVIVFRYTNQIASLSVTYKDGTIGNFTATSMDDLLVWAKARRGWPEAVIKNVSVPYPLVDEPEPEEPVKAKVTRSRTARQTEVVVKHVVSRTRA